MTNVALLRETMAHIENNQYWWNQHSWCLCFAAHAVKLSGSEITGGMYVHEDGKMWPVAAIARRELGLTELQADLLFRASNSLDDLRTLVAQLVEEAGLRELAALVAAEQERELVSV